MLLGAIAAVLALLAMVRFYHKTTNTGCGLAGLGLGIIAQTLGLAYQAKYLRVAMDTLPFGCTLSAACATLAVLLGLLAAGLIWSRTRSARSGTTLAVIATAALIAVGSATLTVADRQHTRAAQVDALQDR